MSKDEDRKKLSWREIDKLKDRSGFSKVRKKFERAERGLSKNDHKTKEKYLKELEKLFINKEEIEKQNFIETLHKNYGTKNFKKLAKEFVEKYGIPDDWRTLLLFLDLDDRNLVLSALEKLKEDFPKRNISEKQGILSKLKTLALTSKDEVIGFKVEKALKELTL
ncbi:MAG: hypothetical protein C0190_02230 [Thermodesulfobacterium geofontis]|uniref:Uncharacterized protein n=1 Tax=Thermodesulfobacterium geofontis TaxID=1295609 RepID=A0A2N7PPL7_9BACT|nr:MAG: hypothetical protein C0190_02230 [Thermodesulfobacterium geofontis]PMP93944.1 MAG: hypothetical protein C0169_07130 [Thermodesulfobacterium geofontis]